MLKLAAAAAAALLARTEVEFIDRDAGTAWMRSVDAGVSTVERSDCFDVVPAAQRYFGDAGGVSPQWFSRRLCLMGEPGLVRVDAGTIVRCVYHESFNSFLPAFRLDEPTCVLSSVRLIEHGRASRATDAGTATIDDCKAVVADLIKLLSSPVPEPPIDIVETDGSEWFYEWTGAGGHHFGVARARDGREKPGPQIGCEKLRTLWRASAGVGSKRCSDALANQAVIEIPALVDRVRQQRQPEPFGAVHSAYVKFAGCDDAGPGEALSDLVAASIAENWGTVAGLFQAMTADSAYGDFVLRRVDATCELADLRKIVQLSSASCPKTYQWYCGRLSSAARDALER